MGPFTSGIATQNAAIMDILSVGEQAGPDAGPDTIAWHLEHHH